MTNFRLDKLILTNSAGKYNVSAIFNAGTQSRNILSTHIVGDKSLTCDAKGIASGDSLDTFYPGIDFAAYGNRDMLSILIDDDDELIKELAEIIIKDTDYPPPYSLNSKFVDLSLKNRTFSETFTVKEITFIRQAAPNNHLFAIDFKLNYADQSKYYTIHSFGFETDSRQSQFEALVLKLKISTIRPPVLGELSYPAGQSSILLNLKDFAIRGLPFIIYEGDQATDWNDIDTKKISVFIY
jgi:hypothetical protein